MTKILRSALACAAAMTAAAAVAYVTLVHPRSRRWGATDDEVTRPMPGDDWVPDPTYEATRAITIEATAESIWPWLAQMGKGRGGLYSYDALDRILGFLDAPSAQRILPEFQHIAAGDVIPVGRGNPFPVHHVDESRALVLAGEDGPSRWTWQFGLYEQPDGTTRLVSRNRASGAGHRARIATLVIDPPAFIMTRQMLRNLKKRAERWHVSRVPALLAGARRQECV